VDSARQSRSVNRAQYGAKEACIHSKRGLYTQQKRPVYYTQKKRPVYTAKEACIHSKRGLYTHKKRPTYTAKEAYIDIHRPGMGDEAKLALSKRICREHIL
jgi:hypothetical protein